MFITNFYINAAHFGNLWSKLFQQFFTFQYCLSIYLLRYIEIKRSIDINSFDIGSKNKLWMFSYDIPVSN